MDNSSSTMKITTFKGNTEANNQLAACKLCTKKVLITWEFVADVCVGVFV